MTAKTIAIGAIIVFIIVVIIIAVIINTPVVMQPTSTPTVIQPAPHTPIVKPPTTTVIQPAPSTTIVKPPTTTIIQPAPVVQPTPVPVPKWCPNGIYCNKTPVPQAEAGVGSIHCGTGNNQFQCVLDASGNPGWKSLAKTCTTGMKNMCPIVVPAPAPAPVPVTKWCPNGLYCNGTPVPQAEAGVNAIVCGGGNNQFQCVLDASGNPGWKSLAKTCTTGMKNMCPSPMYLGCYKDDVGTRALPVRGANTNVAGCLNSAKSGNYKYFGLQFGSPTTGIGECWMGNDLARAQKYGMITGCTQITGALPGYTMGGGNMNALYSV